MLKIVVPAGEYWDTDKEEFVYTEPTVLELEHSLLSVSKWEAKWEKPFLNSTEKTEEEALDYIRCMTINDNIDDRVYMNLSKSNISEIESYISKKSTATTFSDVETERRNSKRVTSEEIYSWMTTLQIPFECEKWHINRLLTLIKACNANQQEHKVNTNLTQDALSKRAALNAERKKKLGTHG